MKIKTAMIALLVSIFALGTGYAIAGGMKGGYMGMQGPGMSYIFDELDITQDQQDQIEVIMADFREEMRASMAGRTERPSEEEMAQHKDILKARLSSVLTAEQLEGLDKYQAAHQGMRGHGKHSMGSTDSCDNEGRKGKMGNGMGKGYGQNNS